MDPLTPRTQCECTAALETRRALEHERGLEERMRDPRAVERQALDQELEGNMAVSLCFQHGVVEPGEHFPKRAPARDPRAEGHHIGEIADNPVGITIASGER